MKYYLIIPAHNEAEYIGLTLDSLLSQSVLPSKVVVVNDNSTDQTADIVTRYCKLNPVISLINTTSETAHLPGSKVVNAFLKGFETVDNDFDIIVKLDADLILPPHYFETILNIFKTDAAIGMAGGFAYIEKNGRWVLENLTSKDHIRGAFKAYRKKCFQDIGGLKPAMGWDTVDELLAKFYGWKVITDANLRVKHLKPTGFNYNKAARYKQGEAFYRIGYSTTLIIIAAAKLAFLKQKPLLFLDYIRGYCKAKSSKIPLLVDANQAKFIQNYRWQKILNKFCNP